MSTAASEGLGCREIENFT